MEQPASEGALAGLRVVEFAGIGPAPFATMLLADHGADVIRLERPGGADPLTATRTDITCRNRPSLTLDLRSDDGRAAALRLADAADVLIEGFRPGVMERLGLGPDVCLARNPRLVYGRMTGWGQHGPLAQAPGHDLNYIAISGALHAIGPAAGPPVVPLNYLGDFGGGGMMLAFGVLAALQARQRSGRGQVVDAAMTDGTALLSTFMYGFKAGGRWSNRREDNMLDGAAHFYGCYECADGGFVAVGSIEKPFHAALLAALGLQDDPDFDQPMDQARWPRLKARVAEVFRRRSRAEWTALLEGGDVCFAPVLDWDEAPRHHHNVARRTFAELDGVVQPMPAPRLSATPAAEPRPASRVTLADALARWDA